MRLTDIFKPYNPGEFLKIEITRTRFFFGGKTGKPPEYKVKIQSVEQVVAKDK